MLLNILNTQVAFSIIQLYGAGKVKLRDYLICEQSMI